MVGNGNSVSLVACVKHGVCVIITDCVCIGMEYHLLVTLGNRLCYLMSISHSYPCIQCPAVKKFTNLVKSMFSLQCK